MAPDTKRTFLFIDVQEPTLLLDQVGPEKYRGITAEYRRVVRDVLGRFHGSEVDVSGEEFLTVFDVAGDALVAAGEILVRLQEDRELAGLRVRMGVNSGSAVSVGPAYFGIDINRAARILSVAHVGQVVVSEATANEVNGKWSSVELKDLGRHRLKDLAEPQRLYQLVVKGVKNDFPPVHSLEAFPTNLPVQLTPFIGRRAEVEQIASLLTKGDARLLTLTGPGGVGKTRLSLQAAAEVVDRFADGVCFVSLASLRDANDVLPTIARALGVRESPGRGLEELTHIYLKDKRILLVLDNLEHLLAAVGIISNLLQASQVLKILATSRVLLHIEGEQQYAVNPLAVPDLDDLPDLVRLAAYESVALFIDRARAVKPRFTLDEDNARAVAGICQRLDGIPLAIELAAARIKLFSPAALYERLSQTVGSLAGRARDLPRRHQTLREAIDWSYALLDPVEQQLFSRLSVFVGGCTQDAIKSVCNTDKTLKVHGTEIALKALVDNNLIQQHEQPNSETRFQYLQLIHEFATEKLEETGRADYFRERHAEFYIAQAEQAAPLLHTQRGTKLLHEQRLEHDNLRSALEWAITNKLAETALRVTGATWEFWNYLGYLAEGTSALDRALKLGFESHVQEKNPQLIAESLAGACHCAVIQGNLGKSKGLAQELLSFSQAHAIARGEAYALKTLGMVAVESDDFKSASAFFTRAKKTAQLASENLLTIAALNNLAITSFVINELDDAVSGLTEVLELARADHMTLVEAMALSNLASISLRMGKQNDARSYLLEAIEKNEENRDLGRFLYIFELAAAILVTESPRQAALLLAQGNALSEKLTVPYQRIARQRIDETFEKLRQTLDESELLQCIDEGAKMPVDHAIELARTQLQITHSKTT